MKKVLSAAAAALVAAVVVSVALASTSVKVTSHHTKWVISSTAPAAAGGNVVDAEIFHAGHSVASDSRYTAPTAANGYKWKVVAKKSELPAGRYKVEFVDITSGGTKYLKFPFVIKK